MKDFDPKKMFNWHYVYQVLVNPENKKSRIDTKNVPIKHRKAVNMLKYAVSRWKTEVDEMKQESNKKK